MSSAYGEDLTGDEDFRVRIDELVASALQDQARQQRELTEVVEGARSALVEVRSEMAALRHKLGELAAETTQRLRSLARLPDRVQELGAELDLLREAVAQLPGQVDRRVDEAEGRREAEAQYLRAGLEEVRMVSEVLPAETAAAVAAGVEPLAATVGRLAERVEQAAALAAENRRSLHALTESLVEYLSERERRIERTRDEALGELVDRLALGLGRRDRTRLADALREAEQARLDHRDAERFRKMKAVPPGLGDEAAAVAAKEMTLASREVVEQLRERLAPPEPEPGPREVREPSRPPARRSANRGGSARKPAGSGGAE